METTEPIFREYTLSEPAFIPIGVPGREPVALDVYKVRRALEGFDKLPTQDARMEAAKNYLAAQIGVDPSLLAESNAFELYELVNAIVAKVAEERKKKIESIVCSPQPIQASQPATAIGA